MNSVTVVKVNMAVLAKDGSNTASLQWSLLYSLGASKSLFDAPDKISESRNQRERDRERAQARAGGKTKQPKNDGLTPEQRRESLGQDLIFCFHSLCAGMQKHYRKKLQGKQLRLLEGTMQSHLLMSFQIYELNNWCFAWRALCTEMGRGLNEAATAGLKLNPYACFGDRVEIFSLSKHKKNKSSVVPNGSNNANRFGHHQLLQHLFSVVCNIPETHFLENLLLFTSYCDLYAPGMLSFNLSRPGFASHFLVLS
ncbi:hypothetical protein Fmac_028226 [Flemingia macrophylla]|uniref:Small EDRK-rich factor-like N-terminal domain-containing protein n=1 Tax=Flemingia macrophylla TaxID=520843 RepID=A0ABD1L6W2_9FABA